jgi:hypothetical protein
MSFSRRFITIFTVSFQTSWIEFVFTEFRFQFNFKTPSAFFNFWTFHSLIAIGGGNGLGGTANALRAKLVNRSLCSKGDRSRTDRRCLEYTTSN